MNANRTRVGSHVRASHFGRAASRALRESIPSFAEHLVQMPLNGARTQEQLGADLRVREAVASQPRDLLLLWRELRARLGGRTRGFAPAATNSPRVRSANASIPISANISSATRSRSRASRSRSSRRSHSPKSRCARASSVRSPLRLEPIDRPAIRRFGTIAIEKRPTTRLDAERQAATGRLCGRRQARPVHPARVPCRRRLRPPRPARTAPTSTARAGCLSPTTSRAAAAAPSYRPSPLFSTAAAQ